MNAYEIARIGVFAGIVGTGLGGLLTVILGRPGNKLLSFVLGFSGGIMLAIIFADLLPEALHIGGELVTFAGLLLGVLLIALLDVLLPHTHFFSEDSEKSRFLKTGAILGLGITMHNLPEGLAIGTGFIVSDVTGLSLVLAMVIQNIPEGMAMAAPMVIAGVGYVKCTLLAALAGLPMGIGAYLGARFGTVSPVALSLSLGFAAGAMLYIVFDELIPEAQNLADRGHGGTFGAVAGVVAGLLLLTFVP